jgi:hypothetical protein
MLTDSSGVILTVNPRSGSSESTQQFSVISCGGAAALMWTGPERTLRAHSEKRNKNRALMVHTVAWSLNDDVDIVLVEVTREFRPIQTLHAM